MDVKIIRQLEEIVGRENVLTSIENRIAYSYDATPTFASLPDAIVIPQTPEQISRILKLANEENFIVVPRGSGTSLSGGVVPLPNSIVLLMNRWRKILEIDRENLTALVEPGVITAHLHQEVEKYGLFYPPDPGSMTISTIGGNVAENAGGLRGLKYGVTKNYVLGLEVVLPTGEIINVGGKNVKDVAGYNLKDVLIGSEGTLGIFTKILLKLIPKPQSYKTMIAFFNSLSDAGKTVADIIASHIMPATLEFLDNTTIKCVEDYAHLGLPVNAGALLLIEVDGHPAQVEEEAEKIEKICIKNGATDYKIAKSESEALNLKTARRAAFAALARVKPTTILEDATVPRSFIPEMVEKIQQIANKYQIIIGNFGHAGDGNLHPTALTDERDKEEMKRVEQAFEEIFDYAIKLGGTITGEHGVGLAKKRFLEKQFSNAAIDFMKNIKRVLDPNNILNAGKIFDLKPRCEGRLPTAREEIEKYTGLWA
ncbi:glycolate oxidase [Candidatus Kryptonium thompsonii]|nr:glycolate oxidase [Candidatus Kryptonium thompsoni]